ncbi:hypothetical protein IWW48_002322 [Coemansia sp. RSA 1200]|nr:hypothetical protein IWW48_002322 [Coemansia sp. RSA 1200]
MESTRSPASLSRSGHRFPDLQGLADVTRFITLTIALSGLQFVWSVETGHGSPYLLSLGLQKSAVSLVWLAGPLSGLITQPLVGFLSDNCTSKLGRRRPYIIGATVSAIVCLTIIGWAREIAGGRQAATVWLAVVAFYVLDFAINCIQASLRAIIVDMLPASRQDDGTTWASRMIGIGNVLGYLMGFLDLPRLLPFLGSTQMQILTTIASVSLSLTVFVTCYYTKEVPITHPSVHASDSFKVFGALFASLRSLPASIKQIFRIQFFAWIGWFPFLFYSTTYVADLYVANHGSPDNKAISDEATRAGSLAMFIHAASALIFSIVLPAFTYSAAAVASASSSSPRHYSSTMSNSPSPLLLVFRNISNIWHRIQKKVSISLTTIWIISLCVFAVPLFSTAVISTTNSAMVLMGISGFSWAVGIWVPFSLLGEIISSTSGQSADSGHNGGNRGNDDYTQVASIDTDVGDIPLETIEQGNNGDDVHFRRSRSGSRGSNISGTTNDEDIIGRELETQEPSKSMSAGTVLGLHNVFVVIPQFLTTLASSLIFALFEYMDRSHPKTEGGQHAKEIGIVLCLGGVSATIGAYHAWKLSRF